MCVDLEKAAESCSVVVISLGFLLESAATSERYSESVTERLAGLLTLVQHSC